MLHIMELLSPTTLARARAVSMLWKSLSSRIQAERRELMGVWWRLAQSPNWTDWFHEDFHIAVSAAFKQLMELEDAICMIIKLTSCEMRVTQEKTGVDFKFKSHTSQVVAFDASGFFDMCRVNLGHAVIEVSGFLHAHVGCITHESITRRLSRRDLFSDIIEFRDLRRKSLGMSD